MEKDLLSKNIYFVDLYPNRKLVIDRGRGVYLFDRQGKKYLDLGSNYGVNILGHGHPKLIEKISSQLKQLTNLHGSFTNKVVLEAGKKLIEKIGGGYKVFFVNSGSEAVEVAIKFSFFLTKRKKIAALVNSYHGKTLGALALTDNHHYQTGIPRNLLNYVIRIDQKKIESLEKKLAEDVAAVFIELIQGEGGVKVISNEFVDELQKIGQKRKILVVVDEIQTGVGRTGKFLAKEGYQNLRPEMILLGKGLAGGLPVGAVLVKEEWAKKIPRLFHTSTFGGHPLVGAGIMAVLQVLTDKFLAEVQAKGLFFLQRLKKITHRNIVEVRGKGLMVAVEVKEKRNEILKRLQDHGVIALPSRENVIRFLPPLIISRQQLEKASNLFEQVINLF